MGNSEWGSEKPFKKKICCEKRCTWKKNQKGAKCQRSALGLGPEGGGTGQRPTSGLYRGRVSGCVRPSATSSCFLVLLSGAMTRLAAGRGAVASRPAGGVQPGLPAGRPCGGTWAGVATELGAEEPIRQSGVPNTRASPPPVVPVTCCCVRDAPKLRKAAGVTGGPSAVYTLICILALM